jgi:hypothetical protein
MNSFTRFDLLCPHFWYSLVIRSATEEMIRCSRSSVANPMPHQPSGVDHDCLQCTILLTVWIHKIDTHHGDYAGIVLIRLDYPPPLPPSDSYRRLRLANALCPRDPVVFPLLKDHCIRYDVFEFRHKTKKKRELSSTIYFTMHFLSCGGLQVLNVDT